MKKDSVIYNSESDWTINRIRSLNNKEENNELELTFEPKSKFQSVYRGTTAEKILYQFENPKEYISKNIYF